MERTYTVTTIKTVKVSVDDERLSDEAVREFSEAIFEADKHDIMRHAAAVIAAQGAVFIEGIGPSSLDYAGADTPVRFSFEVESVDVEEVA